jgi:hypothetical protein
VATFALTFQACRKDNLLETCVSSPQGKISVADARAWYENQIRVLSNVNGVDSSLILINPNPQWEEATNDFNKNSKEFLVSPIENQFSSFKRGGSKLLINQDADGNFEGYYAFFLADSIYDKRTSGEYKMTDFTGSIIYVDIVGKMKGGYRYNAGKIVGEATAKRAIRADNKLQVRGCVTETVTTYTWKPYPFKSNLLGYWDSETVYVTNCFSDFGSGWMPSMSSGGGGSSDVYLPNATFAFSSLKAIKNKFIENGLEQVWYKMANNRSLIQATNSFLDTRSWDYTNLMAVDNLITNTADVSVLTDYFNKMATDTDFYNTCFNVGLETSFSSVLKYSQLGFSSQEFVNLYKDQKAFIQANNLLNQIGFSNINSENFVDKVWEKFMLDEGWNNLNDMEKIIAKQNPSELLTYYFSSKDAIAEARNYSFRRFGGPNDEPGNDRNIVNAFQHSYWNAVLTIRMGADRTKVWTDAHEFGLPDNPDNNFATQMDFFNNHQGREAGQVWQASVQQNLGMTLAQTIENWIATGQMRHVCFDSYLPNNPSGQQYTNQRFIYTNQLCR